MKIQELAPTAPLSEVRIDGTCDPRFRRVYDVLHRYLASGTDIGSSAAVFIDGECRVDIWGGYADKACTRPWERDTIVNTFSTTKTMTALCMLVLADRGEIDLAAPVAKYWPEFAAAGKGDIEIRQILGHIAAMPGWTDPVTLDDILDRDKASTLLARQAPWWRPNRTAAYHAITFGPLLGEIVRRVTGKTLTAFFAEDIARPLGADYHIGAGPECDGRVSPMIQGSPVIEPSGDPIADRVFFNPLVTPQFSGTLAWRRGELGGSNGHGNARSVALVQSVIACGGEVGGTRLLSRAGCERVLELQSESTDLVFRMPLRWGMGLALNSPEMVRIYGPRLAGRRVALWGGSGGSFVINDLDARMTVAFVMNRHLEHGGIDSRGVDIVRAAYEGLLGPRSGAAYRR